ncbi:spermine oxidase-like [Eurosta solidaginis]|uniref:spermine oxidase-like n=1 Tax=Eurosta solidaginis TaxID=178769 RepID=UPI0035313FB1
MCFTSLRESDMSAGGSASSFTSESIMQKIKYTKEGEDGSHRVEPSFLIVGAGAAGIACAVTLIKKGFKNVSIVEAEQRIGGRIFTKSFGNSVVELGAQWCHGQRDNVVYETVDAKKMLRSSSHIYANFECIRSDGEVVPKDIVELLKGILAQVFAKGKTEMAKFSGTFGEYLSKNFFKILNDEHSDINQDVAQEFFENFLKIETSETSAGLEEISARGFNAHGTCDGDYMLYFEDGYTQFLRILLEADEHHTDYGLLQDKILFGVRIKEILWDRPDHQVEVNCEDLSIAFVVDHVILTVSLGVLKHNAREMFVPELPESKLRAIDGLGFGHILKVYLEFPTQFWSPRWTGFIMLWREKDLEELRNGTHAWLENIYGFYRVPNQSKALVGWLVGPAITMVEQMHDKDVTEGCMYLLHRFLTNFNIPNPIGFMKSTWSTNPNFCGAYSYRSLKTEELQTSAAELRQPITVLAEVVSNVGNAGEDYASFSVKPIIQFAGEATHDHYFGTVHGAVETGIEAAQRLQGYYSAYL